MPSYLLHRSILKLAIGVITIMLAYRGLKYQDNSLNRSLFRALIVFTAADLFINYNFYVGMALNVVAILILCYRFLRFEKPEKGQWFLWSISSAIAVVYILSRYLPVPQTLAMMGYAIILALLMSLSLTMPKKIRFASWALTISNIIIFITRFNTSETLLLHILSLGFFYTATTLFASATKFSKPITEEIVDYTRKSSRIRHRKRLA